MTRRDGRRSDDMTEPNGDGWAREQNGRNGVEHPPRDYANRQLAMLTIVSVAIALSLSAMSPPALFLPMFATLLLLSATSTAFIALLLGQQVFAPTFTLWDKAAALAALGLATYLAADHEAARLYIEAHAAAASPAPLQNVTAGGK